MMWVPSSDIDFKIDCRLIEVRKWYFKIKRGESYTTRIKNNDNGCNSIQRKNRRSERMQT